MNKMSTVKKICICAICIALCYVLPIAFHTVGLGSTFLPIHLPVLLCGLICGSFYGVCCGIIGPILSSVLTGMPPSTALVSMLPELMAYGLVTGMLMHRVHTGNRYLDLYAALIPAMLVGRIAGGIARALFIVAMANGETYGFALWATSYFVGNLPGIVIQLIAVPALVTVLEKSRLIPQCRCRCKTA